MAAGPVYQGRLIKLYRERVRLPNGRTVELEIIRHPGAALIVPLLSKERLLLLRQFRAAVGGYLYELPAGTRDADETPLSCARREIVEETGYSASKFTVLGDIFPVPGYSTERIRIFKAEGLRKKERCLEADEVATVHELSRQEVRRLFRKGAIKDAKTICALAMLGWI
ncbi:MAG: NUDIX domain-containing protein [Deltaproteobacteria bacterium]